MAGHLHLSFGVNGTTLAQGGWDIGLGCLNFSSRSPLLGESLQLHLLVAVWHVHVWCKSWAADREVHTPLAGTTYIMTSAKTRIP